MADFNSKYDFVPRLENPEETKEIDQNTLEEIFITESELACLDVSYESPAYTSTEEARQEIKNAFKIGKGQYLAQIIQNPPKRKIIKNVLEMQLIQFEDRKHLKNFISTKRSTFFFGGGG